MINIIFASITAFIITFLAIPAVIKIADIKGLYDTPGGRKLHKASIPRLGGLAIFAGVAFSFAFWTAVFKFEPVQYILASMIVMFFIGIKDDIIEMPASKKFIGQLIAALIIVLFGDIRITSMCGVMGIYDIPYYVSAPFSLLLIILIVNAYNLVDGVDGLAGGLGSIASFTFGLWFYNYNEIPLCILSFSVFSALLAFLTYNFSPARIFMGDTGSLIIGLILSILAIQFIELSFNALPFSFPFRSSPAMAIAILIIPLFDTMRIFAVRILHKKSPFSPDRNHMHHILQDMGCSHREICYILYAVHIGFIFLALWLRNISSMILLFIILGLSIFLSLTPFIIKYFHKSKTYNIKVFKH